QALRIAKAIRRLPGFGGFWALGRFRGVPARTRRHARAELPISWASRALRARRTVPCRLACLARAIPQPGLARRRTLRGGEPASFGFPRMAAMGGRRAARRCRSHSKGPWDGG